MAKLPIDWAAPGTGWVIFCHGVAARRVIFCHGVAARPGWRY
ncbi:hypothetical protein LTSEBAI_3361 [Salmonella enterica subsp. enterica serovar Baildon str. R6-199]|nr:hypothetical protein LTSEBAI_3361 [Salmonella enterica subsp. enterica serovar Baildon str. R6-199]